MAAIAAVCRGSVRSGRVFGAPRSWPCRHPVGTGQGPSRGPAQGLQPPLVDASVEVLVSARAEHFGLKSLGEHGKGLVLDRSDRI